MPRNKEHKPSVIDGKLQHVSATAINDFRACERKWWWDKVGHVKRPPPGKGAVRGTEGHARIEHYLTTGQDVLDPLERMGLEHMPFVPVGAGWFVEHESVGLFAEDIPVIGYIDLLRIALGVQAPVVDIIDWKFKKDLSKYGAAPADLTNPKHSEGIQMLTYARWAQQQFSPEIVRVHHVAFQTEGVKRVEKVSAGVNLTSLPGVWDEIVTPVVAGMKRAAGVQHGLEVKPNFDRCNDYGGCPFKTQCFPGEQRNGKGVVEMSFLMNKIRAAMKTDQPISEASPVSSTDVPVATPASSTAPAIIPPDAPANNREPPPVLPKKRGRPAKVQAAPAAEPASTPAPAPAAPTSFPSRTVAPQPASKDKGIHLYFGAYRMGTQMKSLMPYMLELEASVLQEAGIPIGDIRMASDSVLGFGKWVGFMSYAAAQKKPPPGHYAVTEDDARLRCVAEALASVLPPENIVRGGR